MEYMIMPLKRYADFSGRLRRKEYWMFVLFQMLLLVPILLLAVLLGGPNEESGDPFGNTLVLFVLGAYFLVFLIPGIAVQVRRFHDQDKSGWFILLGFIPYIGGIILLVFMCLEGTRGPNRFGPDPKDPYSENVFA
ncbi:DUF805 domain-containing protein [Erythrobacter tepidarius]|uniref:DUF805 domain-containing protein n=1 Tax=Erythrobacter tepidarius TaxID=60454 RepID=UPI000A389DA7|nr:DUF805 domain-containing protein [Erythrobacter tepidarius]